MPAVVIPRVLYPLARHVLGRLSRRSARSQVQAFHRSRFTRFAQVSRSSGLRVSTAGRYSWNRTKVPLYGSLAATIPVAHVNVPNWFWIYEEPVPIDLPSVVWTPRFSSTRYENLGLPVPDGELQTHFKPPRSANAAGGKGPPPEAVRKRRDSKMGLYGAALTHANTLLHYPTELMDIAMAFQNGNGNPLLIAQNLVANEFIDRSIGLRARMLKRHVYNRSWYRMPVGLDTAHRLLTAPIRGSL